MKPGWIAILVFWLSAGWCEAQVFAPAGMRFNVSGGATTRLFQSPNGKHRLEVSTEMGGTTYRPALVGTMNQHDGNVWLSLWQAKFVSEPPGNWLESEVIVADDGSFFVVPSTRNLWVSYLKNGEKHEFPPRGKPLATESYFTSIAEALFESDSMDGEPIARIWDRDADDWKAYFLRTGAEAKVTDELRAKWNAATRQRIVSLVERSQKFAMYQKLTGVARMLASLALRSVKPLQPGELREAHLEFLALRRVPADRVWFQKLLRSDSDQWGQAMSVQSRNRRFVPGPADPYFFENEYFARAAADTMLAVFDQKIARKAMWGRRTNDYFSLGRITGHVALPTPILRGAGMLRIYVTPEGRKNWREATAMLQAPLSAPPIDELDLSDEVGFSFNALPPGKYLVKAVWDKRKPVDFTDKAGPGDYESAWTGPWPVMAGATLSNVVLACTSRAAGGEMYYAADEFAARNWKVTGDVSIYSIAAKSTYAGVSAPLHRWVANTNLATAFDPGIYRISMLAGKPMGVSPVVFEGEPLMVLRRKGGPLVQLRIIDQHGCVFLPSHIDEKKRLSAIVFRTLPRSDATWRLVGYERDPNHLLFDYTITNLTRAKRIELAPQKLPLELDLGKVKMTVTKVGEEASGVWMEATFSENGIITTDWRIPGMFLSDSHGNVISPAEMCREEKTTRIYGNVWSSPALKPPARQESIPFEFAVERLKPYAPKP